jgi:DNA repair protein RadA/Sms
MILAVLDARAGVGIGASDVYLNIAGGLKINEPAADCAVAMALVSALSNRPVPEDVIVFGEIGLSGEIRMVAQAEQRLREAGKLGFRRALVPQSPKLRDKGGTGKAARPMAAIEGLQAVEIGHLQDLVDWLYNESRSLSLEPSAKSSATSSAAAGTGRRS